MFIDDWVLCQEGWQKIKDLFPGTRLEECLVKVWKATPSLRWLQVYRSDLSPTEFTCNPSMLGNESQEWSNLASNPTFLPQLTFLISYGRTQANKWNLVETPFTFLRYGRPVRLSSATSDAVMTVNVNYKLLADASNASLVCSDLERSNWSTYGRLLVEFIESSLHVSAQMKTSPRTLVVTSYNQNNAFRTQDIYPFLADLLTLLGLAATLPKLRHLVFQSSDLIPPDDLLKIDGQESFFQRVGQISPELTSVALKMGRPTSRVRWNKASLTSEEMRAVPSFPRWVPTAQTSGSGMNKILYAYMAGGLDS